MPIIFIAVLAVLLPILLGVLLAFGTARFDNVVTENRETIEKRDRLYNPAVTLGHKLKLESDPQEQFVEARRLAAARAASLPRGANMRIGRKGAENLVTAHDGVQDDPMTAFKIAQYHGWDGARAGIPAAGAAQAAPVAATGPATGGKIELKAGRDYEVIQITDSMSGAEKRKARIANAKAKAQAVKAAKASGQTIGAAAPAQPAAVPQQAAAVPSPVATAVPEPDYIEITDDMPADAVRKARIANAKAKSAYNKALKAAGIDPSAAAQPQAAPVAAAPAAPAPVAPVAAAVPEPDYIEITDDMPADEVRKARISNAKAKSAYNKALKAAGIDPSAAAQPQAAPAPVAAAPAAPAPAAPAAAAAVPEPDYAEITDDMSADEVRRARIANAKAKSAYNKALKAAGIDPASVS